MRRMILPLLFVFICATTITFAETLELKVADAIDIALENNLDLRVLRLDCDWAQREVERARIVDDEQMYIAAIESLQKVTEQYTQQRASISRKVVSDYYKLLQSELTVTKSLDSVNQAKINLEKERVRYNAGLIPQIALFRAENQIALAQSAYINAEHNLETEYLQFRQLLGLPFDQKILLAEFIEPHFEPISVSFDEAYDCALAVSKELKAAQEAVDTARVNVSNLDNEYTPRVKLEEAQLQLEKAKLNLKKVNQSLYFQVRSAFWSLKNGEQDIEAKQRELVLAEKELGSAKAKYQAGLLSDEEFAQEEQRYNDAERALKEAKWAHSQGSHDFLELIGVTKPVWSEEQDASDTVVAS
ncbi:MAG: TolC family protein [Limnochordia bacterium]|jgi:outer membrane protein TolC